MQRTDNQFESSANFIVRSRDANEDIFQLGNRVYHLVYKESDHSSLLNQHSVKKIISQKKLIPFEVFSGKALEDLKTNLNSVVRTEEGHFLRAIISHCSLANETSPVSWTSSMWIQAAKLVLSISEELLENGLELSEVTPDDICFIHSQPCLIRPSRIQAISGKSFEWPASKDYRYRFTNPILRYQEIGIPFQQSLLYENGVEPENLFQEAGWFRSLSPSLFTSALVPSILNQQAKKKGLFFFENEPELAEVIAYRRSLYGKLLKELEKIEEHNLTKNRHKVATKSLLSDEHLSWIKEKINFYHPESFLELSPNDHQLVKYASEIGINCVSIQPEESLCDRLYRESKRQNLNNLCINARASALKNSKFEMVLLHSENFDKLGFKTQTKKELYQELSHLSSRYLILEARFLIDNLPYFKILESQSGWVLLEKLFRS